MDDESLNQRIRYLIEFGGVWDDPIADIRRLARIGIGLGLFGILLNLAHLVA